MSRCATLHEICTASAGINLIFFDISSILVLLLNFFVLLINHNFTIFSFVAKDLEHSKQRIRLRLKCRVVKLLKNTVCGRWWFQIIHNDHDAELPVEAHCLLKLRDHINVFTRLRGNRLLSIDNLVDEDNLVNVDHLLKEDVFLNHLSLRVTR